MRVLQTYLISFKELHSRMSNNFKVGKLKFKEGVAKPVYISKKSKKQEEAEKQEEVDLVQDDKLITYEPKPGTGTITSSGRTIHGNETKFREELEKGDSIIIVNPIFRTVEERAVTLILSDKSILLEQPFLEEYSSYIAFQIRKKTTVIKGENITQKYKEKLEEAGKTKGIKKEEMEVRLKKGMWGYETKQVEVNQNLSREEQLNLRQKMIKDKHCW